jgi:ABC-2 type transport system ATP-binding protein
MNTSPLISVQHLSRFYGKLPAVFDISFTLSPGEVLGFLGPNAAGKSTTMNMLCGNLAPSHGSIHICGIDMLEHPKQAKAQIGYLPETPPLYRELTVNEYLTYCAKINRIPNKKIAGACELAKQRCGLEQVGKRLINNLSKGYQQRVGIAQAIIHSPPVIVLDEPTVGLDPIQIREIRQLIKELGNEYGVILSTHILPEVQITCDRVQIISQGRLVYNDRLENLQNKNIVETTRVHFNRPPDLHTLNNLTGVNAVEATGKGRFRIHHEPETNLAEMIINLSVEENLGLTELTPETKTLEQIFVDITTADETRNTEDVA